MQPENVALLVAGALVVGLLLGQAVGRRQGLQVQQVVLPPDEVAATEQADAEDALAASAPPPPPTLEAAREMVAKMGDADAETLVALGRRKLEHHHALLAAAFLEQAVKVDPAAADVWCDLGRAYAEAGQPAPALKAFGTALERQADLAPAWYHRGLVYQTTGDQTRAVADFEQYLQLAPGGEFAADAKARLSAEP